MTRPDPSNRTSQIAGFDPTEEIGSLTTTEAAPRDANRRGHGNRSVVLMQGENTSHEKYKMRGRRLAIPPEGGSLSNHGRSEPDYRIDPETGCWEWLKHRYLGYGTCNFEGIDGRAHRAYWIVANDRPVPDGHDIHHKCENPGCVNPDHLEPIYKPHHVREHKRAIVALTDEQRAEIRELGRNPDLTQQAIADRFGIPRPTVNKILNGYSWFDGERVLPERDCIACGETFKCTNRRQKRCADCRANRRFASRAAA